MNLVRLVCEAGSRLGGRSCTALDERRPPRNTRCEFGKYETARRHRSMLPKLISIAMLSSEPMLWCRSAARWNATAWSRRRFVASSLTCASRFLRMVLGVAPARAGAAANGRITIHRLAQSAGIRPRSLRPVGYNAPHTNDMEHLMRKHENQKGGRSDRVVGQRRPC
jgi:hypothetical protein